MKVTKKMRRAVYAEVDKHVFPYRPGGGLENCRRCGAEPATQEFESAHDIHGIDVAIDFTARLVAEKFGN